MSLKGNSLLVASALAIAGLTTGCANHMTQVNMKSSSKNSGLNLEIKAPTIDNQKADVVITNHYLLWGIGQKNEVNGNSICGGRPSKIVVEQRWYQALFQWFTFGIYSPMNTSFYCK